MYRKLFFTRTSLFLRDKRKTHTRPFWVETAVNTDSHLQLEIVIRSSMHKHDKRVVTYLVTYYLLDKCVKNIK